MALKYGNRVKVSASSAPGTGDFVLGSAVSGYQSFASAVSGIATGDTVRYVIEDGANWEIGTGTYNSTGPKIARTTVIQSSAGGTTKITASASAIIILTVAAGDFLAADTSTFTAPVSFSSNVTLGSSLTETVYAISDVISGTVTINPANGTIQTWTLTGTASSRTAAFNGSNGTSVTVLISLSDAANTITWSGFTWLNGLVPTLSSTNKTIVSIFKVGSAVYASCPGYVA